MHKTHASGVYTCMVQLFDGPGHAVVVSNYIGGIERLKEGGGGFTVKEITKLAC